MRLIAAILRAARRAWLNSRLNTALGEIDQWWTRPDACALQLVHHMRYIADLRRRLEVA
jgi:hypothetical protein